jgi:hypothetical protein
MDGLETGACSLLITDACGERMQAGRFIVEYETGQDRGKNRHGASLPACSRPVPC